MKGEIHLRCVLAVLMRWASPSYTWAILPYYVARQAASLERLAGFVEGAALASYRQDLAHRSFEWARDERDTTLFANIRTVLMITIQK